MLTKQHQVLISEAVENEIDKIAEGVIPEFRFSFVKWGVPLWYVRQMRRPGTGEGAHYLGYIGPWKGVELKIAAMGELKKPQSASFRLPGKYEHQKIVHGGFEPF